MGKAKRAKRRGNERAPTEGDRAAPTKASVGAKPFLHVELRAFCHATEDPEQVQRALLFAAAFLSPDDVGGSGPSAEELLAQVDHNLTRAQGHFNNPILIYDVTLKRKRDVERFWDQVRAHVELTARIRSQVEARLDDELTLWVRLDKQAACKGGLRLAHGQDVILARAKVATYPKDREAARAFLETFLARPPTPTTNV